MWDARWRSMCSWRAKVFEQMSHRCFAEEEADGVSSSEGSIAPVVLVLVEG